VTDFRAPLSAGIAPRAASIDRDLANERLIDRMMLMLASGVLTLVLVTSIGFQFAGGVQFSPLFYLTTAGYLAVTISCSWLAPRLTTMRDLSACAGRRSYSPPSPCFR